MAATLYFVNGGVDNNWGNKNNWSTISGGTGGVSIPGANDTVIFDSNSPNCIVNTSTAPRSAKILNFFNYSNTIMMTQNISFTSDGSSITLGPNMLITGPGIFSVAINSPTIPFQLTSNGKVWPNGFNFSSGSGTITYNLNDDFNTQGAVSFGTNCIFNNHSLGIAGSFSYTGGTLISGTTTLLFNGTTTIYTSGRIVTSPIKINTAGTITFSPSGTVNVGGDITYVAGTVITTGSTIRLGAAGISTVNYDTNGIVWNVIQYSQSNTLPVALILVSNLNCVIFDTTPTTLMTPLTIKSNIPGTSRQLNISSGITECYNTSTIDIDASHGSAIHLYRGNNNCQNISSYVL